LDLHFRVFLETDRNLIRDAEIHLGLGAGSDLILYGEKTPAVCRDPGLLFTRVDLDLAKEVLDLVGREVLRLKGLVKKEGNGRQPRQEEKKPDDDAPPGPWILDLHRRQSYNKVLGMSTHSSASHACHEPKRWYLKKTWWVVGASLALGAISPWIPSLRAFREAFWAYLSLIGWAVGLGLLLGGIIDHYVPKEYISRLLARPKKRTVLYATGLGLLASACSHGILALSMELHKKGASGPAVVSFLLASPWANFPVTLLLIGLFGVKAFLIIFGAIAVALTTGLALQWLDRKGWIEKNKHAIDFDPSFRIRSDLAGRMKGYPFSFSQLKNDLAAVGRGAVELSEMVLGWVIFGVVLASLAQAYVPTHIFQDYLGPDLSGLFVTLGFATILEVCSEGTAPLALEIYRQTQALGNSFVFLTAGVLTDYTEIGLVWSNLGRKTALWMVLVGVPQVLFLGYLFNRFF